MSESTNSNNNKVEDSQPKEAPAEIKTEEIKKKVSPFLFKTEATPVKQEPEEASMKKQYEVIDNFAKDGGIFNGVGKLYFLSKKTSKMEIRGEGKFIIVKASCGMYRLIMIRDTIMRKGCNHYILPSCKLNKATKVKNGWTWLAIDDKSDVEKNEKETVYFAIFKDDELSDKFEESYNKAMKENEAVLKQKE